MKEPTALALSAKNFPVVAPIGCGSEGLNRLPSALFGYFVFSRNETVLKEIRCTRCHSINKETIEFVNPIRNKIMGSRNMKTCRRRAGGYFHLRAAVDRVGILTVFSGEDAMQ